MEVNPVMECETETVHYTDPSNISRKSRSVKVVNNAKLNDVPKDQELEILKGEIDEENLYKSVLLRNFKQSVFGLLQDKQGGLQ